MAVPSPSAIAHTAIVIGPGLSPLEGARIDVAIDDLLAEFTLTQQFRNTTTQDIEAVFTFPIPMDAVFLGLSATLGERELEGRVIERQKAAREYEEAIASGDSAVLVERTQDGMLTANIGNLKAGEAIKVRLRFAQWLSFNGQEVRFRMPTTIAPRYGQPQMVERDQPVTDLLAQYQFAAEIRVTGLLGRAELSSPTHPLSIRREGETVALALKSAWMDRDFVLDAHFDQVDRCSAMSAPDGEGEIVTVAIAADLAGRQEALDVSLVVDCSGSMGGVGIHYARNALKEIIRGLLPNDQVNLVRFGSSHEKFFKRPEPMDVAMRSRLEEHVASLEANMGGTEMIAALETAATDLASTDSRQERSRVIFVITDGEIHETQRDRLKQICSDAGIRIFCVGVGGSVAEDTLRALSDATSGAVEIVYQNDSMSDRIVSHFRRVRAPAARITDVKWPATPMWSHVPKSFFSGDTIRCFARFDRRVEGDVQVHWQAAKAGQVAMSIRRDSTDEPISTSARMAAYRQHEETANRSKRVELAVRYQLLTNETSAILVAQRAEGDKAGDTPETVRVPQMMATGWGGLAGVGESRAVAACAAPADFDFCADFLIGSALSSAPRSPAGNPARQSMERSKASPMPPPTCTKEEFMAFLRWLEVELQRIVDAGGNLRDALYAAILRWKRNPGPQGKIIAAIVGKATQPKPWLAMVEVLTQRVTPGMRGLEVITLIGAKDPALALIEADLAVARVDSQSIRIA